MPVRHPYDGSEVATVSVPGAEQVERAVTAAAGVYPEFRNSPAHVRAGAVHRSAIRAAELPNTSAINGALKREPRRSGSSTALAGMTRCG